MFLVYEKKIIRIDQLNLKIYSQTIKGSVHSSSSKAGSDIISPLKKTFLSTSCDPDFVPDLYPVLVKRTQGLLGYFEKNEDEDETEEEAQVEYKGKKMGERIYAAVIQEKEDLDEVILTRKTLEKGIQVCLDEKTEPVQAVKTVSKGIQVGYGDHSKEEVSSEALSNASAPPRPRPPRTPQPPPRARCV